MSVEANKALVRRWLEDVWNSSDLAAIDLLFAPNYTVNDVSYPPAAVKQAVQYLHTAFAPITATIEDLIAEDDKVVVRCSSPVSCPASRAGRLTDGSRWLSSAAAGVILPCQSTYHCDGGAV